MSSLTDGIHDCWVYCSQLCRGWHDGVSIVVTVTSNSQKARLHLIHLNALLTLVSEPVPSEAHFGTSTLFNLHIIWMQFTAFRHCALQKRISTIVWTIPERMVWQAAYTSSLYWDGFDKGWWRHAVSKCWGYFTKVLQSVLLCTFVSLAACQWRRGQTTLPPGGAESDK